MWERTDITATITSDETTLLPTVETTLPTLKEETEADRLTAARNRGVTIGLLVMFALFAVCAIGTAFGAFIMRVLVL